MSFEHYFFILLLIGNIPNLKTSDIADDCAKTLVDLFENPDFKMISNSGKGINDLGFYEECNNDPASKYVLISGSIASAGPFKANLGFCGPRNCSLQNYDDFYMFLEPFLMKTLNFTDSSEISFSFTFPSDLNNRGYTAGSLIMIIIICLILLTCLLGTFIDINENHFPFVQKLFKKKDKKESLLITQGEEQEALVSRKQKRSNLVTFFCCFSYLANINKLLGGLSSGANPRLEIFNGIRVISMMWIVFGHTYYYLSVTPILNPSKVFAIPDSFWYQILLQGPLSVDSFFFMAGFLSSYTMIGEIKKKKGKINFAMLYFHRFYRIMPLYAFLIFIAWKVEPFLNQGPIWPEYITTFEDSCSKYWWTNILFVNNFISWDSPCTCFAWGWYLANDFQFFLITPFLLLIYYRSKVLGWVSVGTILLASFILTMYLAIDNDFPVDLVTLMPKNTDYWNIIYCKPYCRISAYLVGIILAYLYKEQCDSETKPNAFAIKAKRAVSNDYVRYFLYFLAFWCITLPVFLPYDANHNPGSWSTASNAIYITFSRPVFALGVSFLAYPVLLGHGRLIYRFLAAGIWGPLAKITFAAYLVHPMLIQFNYYGTKQGVYFNSTSSFITYCAHLFMAYVLALVLSVSIESPLLNLEKNFIFKRKAGEPNEKDAGREPKGTEIFQDEKTDDKETLLLVKEDEKPEGRTKSIN